MSTLELRRQFDTPHSIPPSVRLAADPKASGETDEERLYVMRDLYRELTELQGFPRAQRAVQDEIERLRAMWRHT